MKEDDTHTKGIQQDSSNIGVIDLEIKGQEVFQGWNENCVIVYGY